MSNHKILITGAGGYIGSRAFEYLKSNGFEVFGPTRQEADFTDTARMVEVLRDVQPDIILHCGGVTPHRDISADDFFKVNYEGAKNLLEACALQDVKFINASTIGVYGAPTNDGVVKTDDECHPLSAYAQSKYDFEMELRRSDVAYVNIRIANIPGRDAFINYVMDRGEVNLYGDTPYVRDYIHLDDLMRFFERAITYLMDGGASVTLNAGSGVGYAFPDIVDEIERQTNVDIKRNNHPIKQGDVVKIICDIAHANDILGWKPQLTKLEDIIKYAVHNR